MKRFFSNLLIIIYAVIAIFVTVCLLSFNDNRVTEFGDYSLIIIDNSEIQGDFQKGSLAIVCKDPLPKVGEKAFFYNVLNRNEIVLAEVDDITVYPNTEDTYSFSGDALVSESAIIGTTASAKVIPYAGTILKILESKWGYLFLVVLVSLLMFLYELTKAIEEIRDSKSEERKDIKEKYDELNTKKEEVHEETKPAPASVIEEPKEEVKPEPVEEKKETESVEEKAKATDEVKPEETESNEENKEEVSEDTSVTEENKEEPKEKTDEVEEVKEEVTEKEENKEEKKSENVEINEEIRETAEEKDLLDKIDEIGEEDSLEDNKEDTDKDKKEENK